MGILNSPLTYASDPEQVIRARFKRKIKISAREAREIIKEFLKHDVHQGFSEFEIVSIIWNGTYSVKYNEIGKINTEYQHPSVIMFVHESAPKGTISILRRIAKRLFIVCDREIKRRPRKTKKSFTSKHLFSTKEGMLKADERRFIKIEPENAEKFLAALTSDAKPTKRLLDAIEQAKKARS